ncbi:MAG: dipeptide epimerase [Propionibacteriaceae bacterium]|jgi:L-alanine-DL-glutamate epimerase-like enolase superfamily enzyme|nr:dipeptide epimerase [Propionibacteriaceae bacterium]
MRVTRVAAERVAVPLAAPFEVALGVIDTADTVVVRLETDAGLVGYGEGAGVTFVTGETSESVLGAIRLLEPVVVGQSPFAIDHVHRGMDQALVGHGSAKAALDLALYDLMGQAAGLPLFRFLGGVAGRVEIDHTIGLADPAAMAARAAELVAEGYRELKVKAGADDAQDRAAIAAIRAAAPAARLKVDANQGWTPRQAVLLADEYAKHGVAAIEQPVPHWDRAGLAWVRSHSPIPVMADESCFTPHDAADLVSLGAVDAINIKLMKCGGIYPALQIDAIAEAAGVTTMVGCMLESRLAIAAGAHLAAARPNVKDADLDSFRDFDDTSLVRSAFAFTPPVIALTEAPGLGVDLAW